MDRAFSIIGYLLLIGFALSWIDTLWIFGVEDSKQYTVWNLIRELAQ